MIEMLVNMLSMCIPFSVALLLASLGEMFNQRAGVFNLGCEGMMAMGAFIGMLIPFSAGGGGKNLPGGGWRKRDGRGH